MGIRDEIKAIEQDFERALSSITMRSFYLKNRIEKWEKGDKEVGKLGDLYER